MSAPDSPQRVLRPPRNQFYHYLEFLVYVTILMVIVRSIMFYYQDDIIRKQQKTQSAAHWRGKRSLPAAVWDPSRPEDRIAIPLDHLFVEKPQSRYERLRNLLVKDPDTKVFMANPEYFKAIDFWLRMFNVTDEKAIGTILALESVPERLSKKVVQTYHDAQSEEEKTQILLGVFAAKGDMDDDYEEGLGGDEPVAGQAELRKFLKVGFSLAHLLKEMEDVAALERKNQSQVKSRIQTQKDRVKLKRRLDVKKRKLLPKTDEQIRRMDDQINDIERLIAQKQNQKLDEEVKKIILSVEREEKAPQESPQYVDEEITVDADDETRKVLKPLENEDVSALEQPLARHDEAMKELQKLDAQLRHDLTTTKTPAPRTILHGVTRHPPTTVSSSPDRHDVVPQRHQLKQQAPVSISDDQPASSSSLVALGLPLLIFAILIVIYVSRHKVKVLRPFRSYAVRFSRMRE
ncbi:hypothetical protein TCAL_12873 [Tigriopus californicus]|uniref:Uncharacterized protein n=1 Tax=Tigriopus californicus TaxID=6832 RepID=A0A553P2L1_TIGCA|nr:uncharacterized protein LOC131883489 [Tigriopus californicus]TRY71919.1 hypothetical protein TCAL_12873 [Tigriopus californicus]|eukprot:TCALIF_12873-PA protein Name:"Protein of unknown function" AED:0.00 eAED:0.00 QI:89/1/1/1/1/1/3/103/461